MIDLFKLINNALVGIDIMNIELVDIEKSTGGLLRVIIDKPSGIQIIDCELVTRHLMRILEVNKVEYNRLEVTSPGLDRPLKKESDFLRFINNRVEIKFYQPINGRKVFTGILFLENSEKKDFNSEDDHLISFGLHCETKQNKEESNIIKFTIDCVDRAKLAPIIDFKGKKR